MIDVEIGHGNAFLFECLAGVEHGMMLDLGCDDVAGGYLIFLQISVYRAFDGPVIALRTAAGKINFTRFTP